MRENLNHNQYSSKRILFIEINPLFNRYDIVDRILQTTSYLRIIDKIGVLFFDRKSRSYVLKIANKNNLEVLRGYIYELIDYFLDKCRYLVELDENSRYNEYLLKTAHCFIAGMHSDIPSSIRDYLSSKYTMYRSSLSKMPYLSSQIPYILELFCTSRNHYIYILHL